MARRLVVFPVMGRRWAFSAVFPTASDGKNVPVGSVRTLLDKFRSTPQNSDRVELISEFVSDKMHEKFTAWGATPEGSIRNRVHSIGQRLLARLGPTESLLKSIHKDTGLVEIVYPQSGEVVHRRYFYGSVAFLPFSVVLGILPLPNVFLAWNLFRAYSHWRALQGSRRLSYLVTEPSARSSDTEGEQRKHSTNDLTPDVKTHTNKTHHWVLVPSDKLDTLLGSTNISREPINEAVIEEICKEYPLEPLEIMKWRDHKLPIKSFG